jgi:hypothetical protein
METKSSSLTGPLWVIAIGILILGIGACFTGYMLWDQRNAAEAPTTKWPTNSAELRELLRTNPDAFRNRVMPPTGKPTLQGSVARDQSRPVNIVETVTVPIETNATIVLPPPASRPPARPALSGGALSQPLGGLISGRVTLRGTPPQEKPLPLDALCGRFYEGSPRPTTAFYVVSPDNGFGDVVVHLKAVQAGFNHPIPSQPHVIDQVRCVYVPYVSAARAGQTIELRNSDPILHNIHPTPAVPGNPESNKAQMPNGAPLNFVFPQPEMFVRFKCDVHPWMFAYVSIFSHPYFAVTTPDGRFEFPAPPPGNYVIEAVHRKTHQSVGAGLQREFNIGANENLQIDFEITVPVANQ